MFSDVYNKAVLHLVVARDKPEYTQSLAKKINQLLDAYTENRIDDYFNIETEISEMLKHVNKHIDTIRLDKIKTYIHEQNKSNSSFSDINTNITKLHNVILAGNSKICDKLFYHEEQINKLMQNIEKNRRDNIKSSTSNHIKDKKIKQKDQIVNFVNANPNNEYTVKDLENNIAGVSNMSSQAGELVKRQLIHVRKEGRICIYSTINKNN
jgi:hypothetical protein